MKHGTPTIHVGDTIEVMRTLPAGWFHTCVTSPPYWGLRQYLFDGAVVLRSELSEELRREILAELHRLNIKPRV